MKIFTWFKNLDMKYKVYGVIGGFYFSNHFEPWVRRWWLWFNVLYATFYSLLVIGYYIVVDKHEHWKSKVFVFIMVQSFVYSTAIIPLVTRYFRDEIEIVLLLNSKRDTERVEHMDHLKITKKNIIYLQIIFYTVLSALYIGFFIYLLNPDNVARFHDARFYIVPNPWILKINSPLQYIGISILTGWMTYAFVIISFTSILNTLVMAYEIYIAFTNLHCHIAQLSEHSKMPLSNFHTKWPTLGNRSKVNISYRKEYEDEHRILMKKMAKTIAIYQYLRRILNKVKTYVEFQFTFVFIILVQSELLLITSLYSPSTPIIEKFGGVLIFVLINIVSFCLCYTGRIFMQMGEMTAEHVYNIPWYNLNPRERKTYYLFLHLAHKPVHFNAVKIFTVGMPLFLQVSKLFYTYANFLRTVYVSRRN